MTSLQITKWILMLSQYDILLNIQTATAKNKGKATNKQKKD